MLERWGCIFRLEDREDWSLEASGSGHHAACILYTRPHNMRLNYRQNGYPDGSLSGWLALRHKWVRTTLGSRRSIFSEPGMTMDSSTLSAYEQTQLISMGISLVTLLSAGAAHVCVCVFCTYLDACLAEALCHL